MRPLLPVLLAALAAAPALGQAKPKPKPKPKAAPKRAPKPAPRPAAGPDRPSKLAPNTPFVVVDGEVVPVSTYVDRLSLAFAPQMREMLIEETLIRREAKQRGIKVTQAEIDKLVSRAYGDTLRRYGSEENLARDLKATRGWSIADYKVVIREQAEPQVLREKIAQALVADSAVKEEEIAARYEANKQQFSVPETVRISHIVILRPSEANPEEEAAAKAKAEGLLRQVSAPGADFAKIAMASSEDRATAAAGGKIPTELVRGAHPFGAAFEATVFSAEPGLIDKVVPTPLGFHVIRLDSKKPGRLLTLNEVKGQIKQALLTERRQRAMEELFVQLRTKAKIDTGRF